MLFSGGKVLVIREAKIEDALDIAKVQVDTWQTTYQGLLPSEYLESLSYAEKAVQWESLIEDEKTLVIVGEVESGEIIGFAAGGPERSGNPIYKGEIYAVYILKKHQQKGIGALLVTHLVRDLRESGLFSMLVWVLKGNPSNQFYSYIGGHEIRRTQEEIDNGLVIDVVSYGWLDTQEILDRK